MQDDSLYKFIKAILTIMLLILLWPLIQWFIIIIIIIILLLYIRGKIHQNKINQQYEEYQKDFFEQPNNQYNNSYTYNDSNNDDIIDVTYKEK